MQSTTKPESIFLERTDSRIPLVREVYSLEDRGTALTPLGKGYVDAIAAHETAIRQYMKDYDVDYRILTKVFSRQELVWRLQKTMRVD